MALIIAGERSGVGKTTVTLALLSFLYQQRLKTQSFKVGPDYIDPMFHRYVTGRPCRNLDPVLTSETYVQQCFARHSQDVTHALIEGVMGLFDGAAGREDFASTAHIARLLKLPVLLVVDCSRMSHSIAALVHGYRTFDSRIQLAGVVLNQVGSDRHLEFLKSALAPLSVPILGILRRQSEITIPDRHLGLVPTAELDNLSPIIKQLAHLGKTCFDWEQLLPLLKVEPHDSGVVLPEAAIQIQAENLNREFNIQYSTGKIRVAIAQDSAFSFYYQDNLDLLTELGAELVPWSPLNDAELPEDIRGIYLGGGFPEMFAAQLAQNEAARESVRSAVAAGMPTYAECGGLMYLCRNIVDFEGRSLPMAGVLSTTAVMGKRLTLGYRQVIVLQDGVILKQGETTWGHEFHRSYLTDTSDYPLFEIKNQDPNVPHSTPDTPHPPVLEGWHLPHLHASYLHLHWGATSKIPLRFLQHCVAAQSS